MATLLHLAGIALLFSVCLAAIVSLLFGLPGTVVIVIAALIYAWATGFAVVQWSTIGWLTLLAVIGEGLELVSSAGVGGDQAPSRRVQISAILGAFAGSLVGAPFFFGLGALAGALLGAFAGAALAVAHAGGSTEHMIAHGWAALRGRFLGFVLKSAIAVTMIAVVVASFLW